MTSMIEMAHPATSGTWGIRRFNAMAKPITWSVSTCRRTEYETWSGSGAYLCYIRGNDGSLGKGVQDVVEPSREKRATSLSEIQAADCTELDCQALEENGKNIREQNDEQQVEAI